MKKALLIAAAVSCWANLAAAGKGSIAVTSDPEGARIFLNGIPEGKTPETISGLGSGEYRIELRKEGYDRIYKAVGLLEGQKDAAHFRLKRTTGLLLVDSTSKDANVIVGGEIIGTTPALITDLPLGNHRVEVHASGFPSHSVNVGMANRKPVRVYVKHAPRVAVNSHPPGAEIIVGNKLVGTTPFVLTNLTEGAHQIVARLEEYDSQEKTIQLVPGLNPAIEFNMEKNSGVLMLDTEPALVHVYVDGDLFATTQPKEGGVDSASQPLRMALKAGVDYNIQLVRDGYTSMAMAVRTDVGQVVTRHKVLERIFAYDTRIITDSEVIKCRLEYKLPNGDLYYERYPGVYYTTKAADVHDVQPISLNDESNREARRQMEKNKDLSQK